MVLPKSAWVLCLLLGQLTSGVGILLKQMNSLDWKVRRDGFYDLIWLGDPMADHQTFRFSASVQKLSERDPADADAVKISLIRLLQQENGTVREYARKGQRFSEEYSNYYGDVIGTVSGLKDGRAISALVGAVDTGGMAERGLAEFGPAALEPVLRLLNNRTEDEMRRAGAVSVLADMLKPQYAVKMSSPDVRMKIERALLAAASDHKFAVRLAAVTALGDVGNRNSIPVLERLAAQDPVCLPGEADGGKDLYPIRLAARRALVRLQSK